MVHSPRVPFFLGLTPPSDEPMHARALVCSRACATFGYFYEFHGYAENNGACLIFVQRVVVKKCDMEAVAWQAR